MCPLQLLCYINRYWLSTAAIGNEDGLKSTSRGVKTDPITAEIDKRRIYLFGHSDAINGAMVPVSYRRSLLTRWSGRDRLAVFIVAVTTAFLVGAVVVLLAVAGHTTAIASDLGSETAVELTDTQRTSSTGTALPVSTVTVEGKRYTIVGIPVEAPQGIPSPDGVAGPLSGDTALLVGQQTTLDKPVVEQNGETPFPESWLVTDAATVERLGTDQSLIVRETAGPVPQTGAPLVGALAFFLTGTRQVLRLLTVVCAGAAVLIGVIVFSVTRMTVRERRETLRVLRATGATPARVLGLVAARAGLLTVVGVTIGYALGVIIPNAAVNFAVTLGYPIGLPMTISTQTALVVVGMLGALVCVGILAGVLAGVSIVRGAPLDASGTISRGWPGGPSFLPGGAVVPTTATLAVFIAFVLVVFSLSGVVGSVGGTADRGGGTIVAPNAVHPVASQVDMAYADALQRAGTSASPEILLFLVHDGQPFPARGVAFDAYQSVTNAEVVAGRAPNTTDEAVIGTDLAKTLGLGPGDELALGGSTNAGVATVELVGTFSASGASNDHLLVSLPVARHLSTVSPRNVNLIRVSKRQTTTPGSETVVLGVSAPQQVVRGQAVPVRVQVRNVGSAATTATIRGHVGSQTRTRQVSLSADQQRMVTLRFNATESGTQTVEVGNTTQTVRVVESDALQLSQIPKVGPTNATFQMRVRTMTETPVSNASITIGDRSTKTSTDGVAQVQLPATEDTYTVQVRAGDRSVTQQIQVREDATRAPVVQLSMENETGVFVSPTVRATVSNPWASPQQTTVTLRGPGTTVRKNVELAAGGSKTISTTLARRPPGTYSVRASAGEMTAEQEYRVTGDDRLASAIASSGRVSGGVGTSGFIARAFGNIGLVLATLLGLGIVMTVGSTVASFADAVQARRHDVGVHRAVGAGPLQVGRLVVSDALRIAIPAGVGGALLAVIALAWLSWAGALTVFGVRLAPRVPIQLVGGITLGAFTLALVSAVVVVIQYVRIDPAQQFGGQR